MISERSLNSRLNAGGMPRLWRSLVYEWPGFEQLRDRRYTIVISQNDEIVVGKNRDG
jgi:hypothetical protein